MRDFATFYRGWVDFDGTNPTRFRQSGFHDWFVPGILGDRGYGVLRRFDDKIRWAAELIRKVPHGFVGPAFRSRHIPGVAFWSTGIHPLHDCLDLGIG